MHTVLFEVTASDTNHLFRPRLGGVCSVDWLRSSSTPCLGFNGSMAHPFKPFFGQVKHADEGWRGILLSLISLGRLPDPFIRPSRSATRKSKIAVQSRRRLKHRRTGPAGVDTGFQDHDELSLDSRRPILHSNFLGLNAGTPVILGYSPGLRFFLVHSRGQFSLQCRLRATVFLASSDCPCCHCLLSAGAFSPLPLSCGRHWRLFSGQSSGYGLDDARFCLSVTFPYHWLSRSLLLSPFRLGVFSPLPLTCGRHWRPSFSALAGYTPLKRRKP
ncbi:hypothetical protein C2E23DRAFT_218220 [Lenzites betulinus]|nr:hypothetical protein C2E23DRAFT_218220 [Lenzites betulinus]